MTPAQTKARAKIVAERLELIVADDAAWRALLMLWLKAAGKPMLIVTDADGTAGLRALLMTFWASEYRDPPLLSAPTQAPAGSLDKIEVLRARRAKGQDLWHADDPWIQPGADEVGTGEATNLRNGRLSKTSRMSA